MYVIQSAGSLATTDEVLDRVERDLAGNGESLATVDRLFEAALYLGRLSREVVATHEATLGSGGDGDVHPRWADRRRVTGDLPRLSGGELHPSI